MAASLILNATFEPLSVVPARRAVVLVARGRASVIAERDEVWHSERMAMAVPSVAKLNTSSGCRSSEPCRCRDGRCSVATVTPANTAAPRPKASTM
jgi:hypothetical protein